MDAQRIVFLLSAFLLIPHGAQSIGRSLQQEEDCSDCGPGCPEVAFLVGGEDLSGPEPFMASLRNPDGSHLCGGTLIAPNVILTAAHCVVDDIGRIFRPKVHVGRFTRTYCDGKDFDVLRTKRSIVHPQFFSQFDRKPYDNDNDIALLVLDSSSSRKPIKLASFDSCFEFSGGCRVRLLGWGDTTSAIGQVVPSQILQEAFTTSVSRSTCEAQVPDHTITSSMICAGEPEGGVDACGGDSGGPMILESGEQVGIVSFGVGCAKRNSPGVYASVPRLLGWIQDELDKLSGSSLGPCDCTRFGVSGGVNTGRFGCARHLKDKGDPGRFCMVRGGTKCPRATESNPFPEAAWKDC